MKRNYNLSKCFGNVLKTNVLAIVAMLISATTLSAQQGTDDANGDANDIFRLGVEARFDYLNEALAGDVNAAASGFKVRYFNLRIDGQIMPNLTYSWRQRFNRANSLSEFAENTDWLTLTYKPTKNWGVSAGKQVVMIGGFEYDRAPIDLYFCSEYWNNVACYQLGASVSYTTNDYDETITFQVCQSPYQKSGPNLMLNANGVPTIKNNLLAYNLFCSTSHDWYTGLHSINLVEYQRGKFDLYLVLGNQFTFGDAKIQLDIMDRGTSFEDLDNFSIMGEFSYLFADRVNLFVKATYDQSSEDYASGLYIAPGTEITRVGGGVEYYPFGHKGNRDVRLHAAYAYNFGTNTNSAGALQNKGSFFTAGLTWRVDIMKAARNIIKKAQRGE